MALNRVAGDRGEWLVILDHEDGVEAVDAGMSSEPNGKTPPVSNGCSVDNLVSFGDAPVMANLFP